MRMVTIEVTWSIAIIQLLFHFSYCHKKTYEIVCMETEILWYTAQLCIRIRWCSICGIRIGFFWRNIANSADSYISKRTNTATQQERDRTSVDGKLAFLQRRSISGVKWLE